MEALGEVMRSATTEQRSSTWRSSDGARRESAGAQRLAGSVRSGRRLSTLAQGGGPSCGGTKAQFVASPRRPRGRFIASGGRDRTVRVRDLDRGAELHCLRGHDDGVLCVAFSPDGLRIATASRGRTVGIWDVQTRDPLLSLGGHGGPVCAVAFADDGGKEDIGAVGSVAFSAWGLFAVTTSRDGKVRVCDTHLGRRVPMVFFRAFRRVRDALLPAPRVPCQAFACGTETVVIRDASGPVVARWPTPLRHLTPDGQKRVWCGAEGAYLSIFALEGGSGA